MAMSYRSDKTLRRTVVCLLSMLLALTVLHSCDKKNPPKTDKKATRIIAALYPTYEFARNISGDKAIVELLLPPGIEPHSFEPRPQDIVKIQGADIFIFTNRAMETWADRLIKSMEGKRPMFIDASEGIQFIKMQGHHEQGHSHKHDTHSEIDPHVWLDLSNAQKMADNIYRALAEIDPNNRTFYSNNLDRYKAQLSELDRRFNEGLSDCPKRVFISGGHFTFGYLAKRYNLRYQSAYGISPDSEPSAKAIAALSRKVKKEGLKHIFSEELMSPRIAETIARETGTEILQLRSAHNLSRDEFATGTTFISIMQDNLKNLRKGLQCQER